MWQATTKAATNDEPHGGFGIQEHGRRMGDHRATHGLIDKQEGRKQ